MTLEQTTVDSDVERRHRTAVGQPPAARTWRIPGPDGAPEAMMTVRFPDVTITDTEGRSVVLSPEQSVIMGHQIIGALEWIEAGPAEGD